MINLGVKKGLIGIGLGVMVLTSINIGGIQSKAQTIDVDYKEVKGKLDFKEVGVKKYTKNINSVMLLLGKSLEGEKFYNGVRVKNYKLMTTDGKKVYTSGSKYKIITTDKSSRNKYEVKNGYIYKGKTKYSGKVNLYYSSDFLTRDVLNVKKGEVKLLERHKYMLVSKDKKYVVKNESIDTNKNKGYIRVAKGKDKLGGEYKLTVKKGYVYESNKKANITVYSVKGKEYKIKDGKFIGNAKGEVTLSGNRDTYKYELNKLTVDQGKVTKINKATLEYHKINIKSIK